MSIRCLAFALLLAAPLPLTAEEGEKADDTAAVIALSKLGAQMELREGRIVELRLEGEKVDNDALKLLADAQFLQSLSLVRATVTGEGLLHLQDLPGLHTLTIEDTPIDDQDVTELISIKRVNSYVLRGTNISGMGLQRLEALLKKDKRDAAVSFHRGGFLGVAGLYGGTECMITRVVPNSAAEAAGLQAGDVIVEFDGQEIGEFEKFSELVGLAPLESPINMVIRRGGEKLTKTVRLTRGQSAMQ